MDLNSLRHHHRQTAEVLADNARQLHEIADALDPWDEELPRIREAAETAATEAAHASKLASMTFPRIRQWP
jgi:hypothetical protein